MSPKHWCWCLSTIVVHAVATGTALGTPIEISSEGMQFVVVDQPGNTADMRFDASGRGRVDYLFSIGKYEVTVSQWVEFMNAKATTDSAYSLLQTGTEQVTQRGFNGSYRYASQPFMDNLPISHLDWFRAARFANWMHNGKGNGSTENGVYALNGSNQAVTERAVDARFWIPTIDEWHKAAYFNGDNSSPQYWTYATQSHDVPRRTVVDIFFDGDASGVGNSANFNTYDRSAIANIGTTGGPSAFGAYEMTGNVSEIVGYSSGPYVGQVFGWQAMGGDRSNSAAWLAAGMIAGQSTEQRSYLSNGVRLAAVAVPEPSAAVLLAIGSIVVAATKRCRELRCRAARFRG